MEQAGEGGIRPAGPVLVEFFRGEPFRRERMFEVFLNISPVFLIIVCGVAVDRYAYLPPDTHSFLAVYSLRLALPVLIISILAGADAGDLPGGGFWLAILAAQAIVHLLGYCGDLLIARRGKRAAAVTAVSCSCCNAAFLGLAVVANLFPGNAEAMLIAGMCAVAPSLSMATTQVQLEMLSSRAAGGAGGTWAALRRAVLFNPLVIALVCGAVLCLSGLGLPEPVARAAGMIGSTSAPCMLLALGMDMRNKLRLAMSATGGVWPRQAAVHAVKLILHPFLAWGLMEACGVQGLWLAVGVIMTGTATAVGAYVIAQVYQSIAEEAALTVVISNILNLFTITIISHLVLSRGLP
jgi:predicted permease